MLLAVNGDSDINFCLGIKFFGNQGINMCKIFTNNLQEGKIKPYTLCSINLSGFGLSLHQLMDSCYICSCCGNGQGGKWREGCRYKGPLCEASCVLDSVFHHCHGIFSPSDWCYWVCTSTLTCFFVPLWKLFIVCIAAVLELIAFLPSCNVDLK